ncbi:MAG: chemotaxis protein CheD, partial [Deltaproteobacteria bacterium]|nr:chemotaxis protein CheD [Deltaproteobacteria bacterium]
MSVILLDSTTKTAGMVHIALPESEINPEKAKSMPGYFADTGVEALMEQMAREGVALNRNT